MLLVMPNRRRGLVFAPLLFSFLACSQPSAQGSRDAEALRKEVEALKAQQAETQRSLEEVREFLKAATGGRFGAPSLVKSTFDIAGMPANGPADAPLTLIEISDYHCPYCRRHVQQTQPRIYSELVNSGKMRHVFVHYPIAQLHPDAARSHEAASCANDQGKFWDLHAKLFETPLKTAEQLTGVAQAAGIDIAEFRACLDSGKHAKAVQASVERVGRMNVNGTPMFLIGRSAKDSKVTVEKVIEGAQPFEAFKMAADEILAGR
jgi:protein-disulfide isomerase